MTFRLLFILFPLILIAGCSKDEQSIPSDKSIYFPELDATEWESTSPTELDWNMANIPSFLDFLEAGNTRAFMVLKNGKIVMEHYFNTNLQNQPFTRESNWYWASAAKTLKSSLVGIAEDEGHLTLQDISSNYLGSGWSSLTSDQEAQIQIKHHISMTTGLDDEVSNPDCTEPNCFIYKADPGTRWSYHNGPYTIIQDILAGATNLPFDDYFENKLKNPIGMDGRWIQTGDNNVYYSTARSMARFGLLIMNNGRWENQQIIPTDYVRDMTTSSQDINPSYGYLWWLNGHQPSMVPGSQIKFNTELTPNAPAEMYAAMGKNGQLINIIPSQNIVVVRMGDNPSNGLVPITWQDEMWDRLNSILN